MANTYLITLITCLASYPYTHCQSVIVHQILDTRSSDVAHVYLCLLLLSMLLLNNKD